MWSSVTLSSLAEAVWGQVVPCWGTLQAARGHRMLGLLLLGFQGDPQLSPQQPVGIQDSSQGDFLSLSHSLPSFYLPLQTGQSLSLQANAWVLARLAPPNRAPGRWGAGRVQAGLLVAP